MFASTTFADVQEVGHCEAVAENVMDRPARMRSTRC